MPGVAETAAAPVLGGGLGLQGPGALASGEVREPLEKAGAAVEPQPELSAKPPRALGGGALESRQDQIGEGLPGAALGQLDQWRGGETSMGTGGIQQGVSSPEQPRLRGRRMDSPYAPDAHFGNKRSITWTGYKVHVTETCDADTLHVITHVETTEAAVSDVTMTESIHQTLADTQLPPETHIVDAGSVDATWLVESPQDFHIALIGPVRPHISWQAKNTQAYDIS